MLVLAPAAAGTAAEVLKLIMGEAPDGIRRTRMAGAVLRL